MAANACSRIRHNAEFSCFFRLPAEIRRKIFIEVLGDRLIHVKYLWDDDCELKSDAELDFWESEELYQIERWGVLVCDPEAARPLPHDRNMSDDEESESGSDDSDDDDTSSSEYISEDDINSVDWFSIGSEQGNSVDWSSSGSEQGNSVDWSSSGSEQGEEREVGVQEVGPADVGGSTSLDCIPDRSRVSSPSPVSSESIPDVYHNQEFDEMGSQLHEQYLIGHLREDLFSQMWVHNQKKLGFGDAFTKFGYGRAKGAIYEREMPLPILRVCRQMYTEASQVLWETNIFSFNDVASFQQFMSSRTAHQKRSIRRLRLVMDWILLTAAVSWNNALSMSLVDSLRGLRVLWLHINTAMFDKDFENSGIPDLRSSAAWGFTNGIKKLATLPLTYAQVYVFNKDLRPHGRRVRRYEGEPWTEQRKRLFAGVLVAKLLSVENDEN